MLSMLLQWPPVAQNFAILSTPWWLVNWGVIIFPPRFPKNMKQSLKNDGETTHSLQNTHIYIHCITSRHVTSHDNACHCITSHALTHIYDINTWVVLCAWVCGMKIASLPSLPCTTCWVSRCHWRVATTQRWFDQKHVFKSLGLE